MRMWATLAGTAVAVVVAGGCASRQQAQFQETIRKAAKTPVVEAEGDVPTVFRDLAQSGGLDPRTVYVALRNSDALNAAAAGNHHFYVTLGDLPTGARCPLTVIAARELAHDLLH